MRPCDDVHADDLADGAPRGGAGVDRGLDGRHVTGDEDGAEPAADLAPTLELDVRGLEHRVGRLHQRDQTARLDHPDCCLLGHVSLLLFQLSRVCRARPTSASLRGGPRAGAG